MTRRLRPPAPIIVRCGADGTPRQVVRGGHRRRVTHIAAEWVQPGLWWQANAAPAQPGVGEDRHYYRLVLDGLLVYELFHVEARDAWYVDRIID